MNMNLEGEKIGIKNKQGKEEIENMLEKDIIDPIKDRIPYISLSFILLKYMELLGDKLIKNYQKISKKVIKE